MGNYLAIPFLYINGIIQSVLFCDWLFFFFPLCISVRFIDAVAVSSNSFVFIAELCSIV